MFLTLKMNWKFYKGENMEDITNLIIKNEGLIYKIIDKYKNYFELEDLYQVAVIGFIKAYRNYHKEYDTKFTSYAYPYILGEVIKYINNYRSIKVNKNTRSLYSKILKAREILTQKLMKEPSIYDLSLFLEIDEAMINEVIEANTVVDSLDRIISNDENNLMLYDTLGTIDDKLEKYPLLYELAKLSLEERKIIVSRYFNDMSQKEVGQALGMYQVEVSRKERKILKKLKDNIAT